MKKIKIILIFFLITCSVKAENHVVTYGTKSKGTKINIKIYSSLTCPYCAELHVKFLPNLIKKYVEKMHPELNWEVKFGERIDAYGSQQDLADFGRALQGQEMEGYEIFWTQDDDRGNIVRIVKSDNVNEKKDKVDRCLRIARRKMPKTSAYRSGLVVKCRKGMIWKKEK